MPTKKVQTKSFFRPLVGNAVNHAWYHRELWPIAAIAGLAGIGAAVNDVLTQARLSSAIPGTHPLALLTSVSFFKELLENIVSRGPNAAVLTTLIILLLLGCGALILAWSQHVILRTSHHAVTSKTPLSLSELKRDAMHPRVIRILIVDTFVKVLILNVVVATTLLLTKLNPTAIFFDAFFGIVFSLSMLAIAFALNVWGMLTLIAIIKNNVSVVEGLRYAWNVMRTHTVACIELSLLLFAITFGISLVAIAGLILIGVLSIPLFGVMISQGTLFGLTLVTFFGAILASVWAVAGAGFSTLVTYMSWTSLIESLEKMKKPAQSRGGTHAKRTLDHLFG